MRQFKFVAMADGVRNLSEIADQAVAAEGLGYSAFVMTDHLGDGLAPIPSLAAAATATESIRLGTFVLNCGFYHPAILARDLSTLDVLSRGRLEIGLGAGWNKAEFDQAGIPFAGFDERARRFEETVRALKGLMASAPFVMDGAHFTIAGLDGLPAPLQRPHPPILIGGGGRQTLAIAGRHANTVGLAPRLGAGRPDAMSVTASETELKLRWVREAAGARFRDLEINVYTAFGRPVVTPHPMKAARELEESLVKQFGSSPSPDDLLASPHVMIGSQASLVEKLLRMREEHGISSVTVRGFREFAPVVRQLGGT